MTDLDCLESQIPTANMQQLREIIKIPDRIVASDDTIEQVDRILSAAKERARELFGLGGDY